VVRRLRTALGLTSGVSGRVHGEDPALRRQKLLGEGVEPPDPEFAPRAHKDRRVAAPSPWDGSAVLIALFHSECSLG
jgi:hypothetical protein